MPSGVCERAPAAPLQTALSALGRTPVQLPLAPLGGAAVPGSLCATCSAVHSWALRQPLRDSTPHAADFSVPFAGLVVFFAVYLVRWGGCGWMVTFCLYHTAAAELWIPPPAMHTGPPYAAWLQGLCACMSVRHYDFVTLYPFVQGIINNYNFNRYVRFNAMQVRLFCCSRAHLMADSPGGLLWHRLLPCLSPAVWCNGL